MTDNVQSLRGGPVIKREPVPDVVKLFEDLLEAAQSGEIVGFAGAYLHCDDCTSYRRAGMITRGLLGALAIVQYRLLSERDEPNA